MAFAKFLKIKMLEQDLSVSDLALLMNKNESTIKQWRGNISIPKSRDLMKLAGYLDCSVELILESFIN